MQESGKHAIIVDSNPWHREALPWWLSDTGIVFLTILLFFVIGAAILIPRLNNTRTVTVNGLEVLRDIEPTHILIRPKEARKMAREHLDGLIGRPLGSEYREFARPWSGDPISRYYALFHNSIDSFNELRDHYIVREGWRVDFMDNRDKSFPWSVFLNSRGSLLFCQNNPGPHPPTTDLSEDEARHIALRYLAPTLFYNLTGFHESSVTRLSGKQGWLFSFTDSLDYKLVSGRPIVELIVSGDGVSSFKPGLSIPEDQVKAIAAARDRTKQMKFWARIVILLFLLRLFVFTLGRVRHGDWDRRVFWKLALVLVPMIVYNFYDRYHQLRLWISSPELSPSSGIFIYGFGVLLALMVAMLLAWALKWLREREIDPHYMPMLGGKIPLINISSGLSLLGVIMLIGNMGLANMYAGPSEALPIYSNRVSLSFIMFTMYLLAMGFLIFIIHRWEQTRHRTGPKIVSGIVAFLVITSLIIMIALPLYMGPFRSKALIMFFCFIPFTAITGLLLLYQMRIKSWYVCSMIWLTAPILSEFIAPSHKWGGENIFIIVALIGLYGWLLLLPKRFARKLKTSSEG